MYSTELIKQQQHTSENLRQGALTLLEVKDAVDDGDFETAERMMEKVEEAVGFTRMALKGMRILQDAQDI